MNEAANAGGLGPGTVIRRRLFALDDDLLAIGRAVIFSRMRTDNRRGTGCSSLGYALTALAVCVTKSGRAVGDAINDASHGVAVRLIGDALFSLDRDHAK